MDGTGEHYAKWNKPGGEGQIPYDLTFNWNIINKRKNNQWLDTFAYTFLVFDLPFITQSAKLFLEKHIKWVYVLLQASIVDLKNNLTYIIF